MALTRDEMVSLLVGVLPAAMEIVDRGTDADTPVDTFAEIAVSLAAVVVRAAEVDFGL
jgi:hypothetical protein